MHQYMQRFVCPMAVKECSVYEFNLEEALLIYKRMYNLSTFTILKSLSLVY